MGKFGLTRLTTAWTWGKPPPSPLIVYYVPLHEAHIQMAFCPETPKWESQNSQSWDLMTLGPHKLVCRPLIEIRFKTKL